MHSLNDQATGAVQYVDNNYWNEWCLWRYWPIIITGEQKWRELASTAIGSSNSIFLMKWGINMSNSPVLPRYQAQRIAHLPYARTMKPVPRESGLVWKVWLMYWNVRPIYCTTVTTRPQWVNSFIQRRTSFIQRKTWMYYHSKTMFFLSMIRITSIISDLQKHKEKYEKLLSYVCLIYK